MRFGLDVHCLLIFYALSQIFDFSDAQISSFSPLIPSNAPQAIGSDVDITTTVTTTLPTGSLVSILWEFSDEVVGAVSINSAGGTSEILNPDSIYASRIDIRVGVFASDQFTTTLTIRELLASEDGSTVSISFINVVNASLQLNVQECPSSLPYDVVITSSSRPYRYQATGMFSCPTGDLFYSNGTALPSSDTTCLANAEWSGQDNLQCWSAPTVMLNGDLTVIENNDITLTCDYDDTVIPNGTSSIFYFDNVGYILKKEVAFTLQLQREDNGKPILCQAITPYTEIPIHNNTGRSLTETVNVLYISSSVSNKIETSQYVIEASESNYLLRSDQQLTMNCIPSDANPPATCSWQLCSDSRCQTLTSDGGCLITVDLNASSTVTCAAENVVGNVSSTEQTVDVIPVERQVQFNVTGRNITNDGSINSTTYVGESIMISCRLSYENELNTTYLIKLPNNSMISQSSKLFSSVTRFDSGDYICNTNDQFGSFNAAIYLNIIYAATQDDKIPTCEWNLNETEICSVVLFSNPNSQFVSLSTNGSSVASDGSMTIESTGDQDQQTFTFIRTQVTNSDNGRYELTVKSSSSSLFSNSVLYFDIEVVDNTDGNGEPPGTPGLSTGAIAGIIAGVVVVILCSAGYGVYKWRSGTQKKNGNHPNELYPTGSRDHVLTDQPGYIEFPANNSTQINSDNQRKYEVVGPAEDENGYLAVNGSTTGHLRNRASNSQLETDNAGYIVLNGEESNAQSNNQGNTSSSSRRYENIKGAYDDVITAPRAHTVNGSRRYENVEGPYDEINNS
ncbi:uncharacterized protein LOC143444996 [Clavelina lepadiformis]|uniref:uncharacterized protein LOC143444996 n=1 Tax=Clavelina lepadiformis TaxID=159417 RepID=UPI0040424916